MSGPSRHSAPRPRPPQGGCVGSTREGREESSRGRARRDGVTTLCRTSRRPHLIGDGRSGSDSSTGRGAVHWPLPPPPPRAGVSTPYPPLRTRCSKLSKIILRSDRGGTPVAAPLGASTVPRGAGAATLLLRPGDRIEEDYCHGGRLCRPHRRHRRHHLYHSEHGRRRGGGLSPIVERRTCAPARAVPPANGKVTTVLS